jgi:hypothetical protein
LGLSSYRFIQQQFGLYVTNPAHNHRTKSSPCFSLQSRSRSSKKFCSAFKTLQINYKYFNSNIAYKNMLWLYQHCITNFRNHKANFVCTFYGLIYSICIPVCTYMFNTSMMIIFVYNGSTVFKIQNGFVSCNYLGHIIYAASFIY